ncbi:hypothetical protein KS4_10990 [Poriferisphaera corsica]|uniref:Uncharacterized protein n=1 Tax=Poriferisphaera corsica TaxID=2528020 RepID=A0A517YS66_9BACT|nr:hypothetical protein [Poriferisphaera corsica]QDU33058.1 hypothetical protein KS4_10990 [Poriferisphaera corsica]
MSWYWACASGGCCAWIEATKCSGNQSDKRVFVHVDDLPEQVSIFNYGGVQYEHNDCWRIDPNGKRTFLPHGADMVKPSKYYECCQECEDDVDEPPSPGGPGGGGGAGGGGPGGGAGGGGGGGDPPDPGDPGSPETCGIKLQICSAHAGLWDGPDLYISCDSKPEQTQYVRIYGFCFKVPTGPEIDPVPDDAKFVYTGGSFEDCEACAYGKKAQLCPDQPPEAPEIWVRKQDLPGVPDDDQTFGFIYANYCYELRSSGPLELLPLDAFILNPHKQFDECSQCKQGIHAMPCPSEPEPLEQVWVSADELEGKSEVIYFRYKSQCFALDPTEEPSRIPFDASVIVPKDEFPDCPTCICGERSEEGDMGVKAHLCPRQNIDLAEDVWVLEEDLPDEPTYFRRSGNSGDQSSGGGGCYYVDPEDTPRDIPVGSIISRIDNTYENCHDCTTRGGSNNDGDDDEEDDTPPWWPPLPEENFYELNDCETGSGTDKWVRENHVCALFGVVPCDLRGLVFLASDGHCYEVGSQASPKPLGPSATNQLIALLSGDCFGYRLRDCAGEEPEITTRDNLVYYEGKVVRIAGSDACYTVTKEPVCLLDNPVSITIEKNYPDCKPCEDDPPSDGGTSGDCIGCDQV